MASELGKQIRKARERAHLSQKQLGVLVGSSFRTIGNWERGKTVPRNRLAAIEEALDVDLGSGEYGEASASSPVEDAFRTAIKNYLPESARERLSEMEMEELTVVAKESVARRLREMNKDANPHRSD